MKNDRSRRRSRSRAPAGTRRRLAVEPLEVRMLLASLTSRLPPIVLSPGSEPVEIRQAENPDEVTTLPSAAVSALKSLAILQDMLNEPFVADDNTMLGHFQQEIWAPVEPLLEDQSYPSLELDAAIEVAIAGFEVVNAPFDVAIEQVFGPPLTTQLPVTTDDEPPAAPPQVNQPPRTSDEFAVDLTEGHTNVERELSPARSPDAERSERSQSEVEPAQTRSTIPFAEHNVSGRVVVNVDSFEKLHDTPDLEPSEEQHDRPDPQTNGMILLDQPVASRSAPKHGGTQTTESAGDLGTTNGAGLDDHPALAQMLLLPMAPESASGRQSEPPIVVAGFNPVAMLQIFVGLERGDGGQQAAQLESDLGLGDADVASSPLALSEQLLLGAFTVLVGYWYFHTRTDVAFVQVGPPLRGGRWRRNSLLMKYFGSN